MAKRVEKEKKPEEPKEDFPEAHKEVNYSYGGPDSYESKRKQKLTAREVITVSLATLEHLKWFEVPITFDCSDHPDIVPNPGGILSQLAPSSRMSSSTESSSMEAAPGTTSS
jgi:hypothetical protein